MKLGGASLAVGRNPVISGLVAAKILDWLGRLFGWTGWARANLRFHYDDYTIGGVTLA
jgi:hypothetical protein